MTTPAEVTKTMSPYQYWKLLAVTQNTLLLERVEHLGPIYVKRFFEPPGVHHLSFNVFDLSALFTGFAFLPNIIRGEVWENAAREQPNQLEPFYRSRQTQLADGATADTRPQGSAY